MKFLKNKRRLIEIAVIAVLGILVVVLPKTIKNSSGPASKSEKVLSDEAQNTDGLIYSKYSIPNGIANSQESKDGKYYYFSNVNGIYKFNADSLDDVEDHIYTENDSIWYKEYFNIRFIQPLDDGKCMIANATNVYILDEDGNEVSKMDLSIAEELYVENISYVENQVLVTMKNDAEQKYEVVGYSLDGTEMWKKAYSTNDFTISNYSIDSNGLLICGDTADEKGRLIKVNSAGEEVFNIELLHSAKIKVTDKNTYVLSDVGYISIIDIDGNKKYEKLDYSLCPRIDDNSIWLEYVGNIKRLDFEGNTILDLDNENYDKYYYSITEGQSYKDNRFISSETSDLDTSSKSYSLIDENKIPIYKIQDLDLMQIFKTYINDKNELTILGAMYKEQNGEFISTYYAYFVNSDGEITKKVEIPDYPYIYDSKNIYTINEQGISYFNLEKNETIKDPVDISKCLRKEFSNTNRFIFIEYPHM